MLKLQLKIVSQEKELLSTAVDQVTLPTSSGVITILPKHIGLFSQVTMGELVYQIDNQAHSVVVTDGFLNVSPENTVTVLVDSAKDARDLTVLAAEKAVQAAHETMKQSKDQKEAMMAEASLRLAMLELKIAQKSKKTTV